MDVEKVVGGSEPHKMITCSGLSISPPLLATTDQDFNSEAQKGIAISHKEGTTYSSSLAIVSQIVHTNSFFDKQDTLVRSAR